MSYAADLTADLANWIAGLIREMLTDAPPPTQRNTAEWLLERLDQAGLAPLDTSAVAARGDDPVPMSLSEPPVDDEGAEV